MRKKRKSWRRNTIKIDEKEMKKIEKKKTRGYPSRERGYKNLREFGLV